MCCIDQRFYNRVRLYITTEKELTYSYMTSKKRLTFNPLNAELNSICHLLALLGARPILHISRIRVKNLRPLYRTGVPLPSICCFLNIFSTNISTEYFKHTAHSPFLSSKCRLFYKATFFGSCIIHILHSGCAKI
jgi:hypothetical protein